ncbi:MAG: serpin family protein [Longimicrobiales bacterium]
MSASGSTPDRVRLRMARPRHRLLPVLTAGLLLVTAACNGSNGFPTEPVRDFTSDELQVSSANTDFGFTLLRGVAQSASESNVMLSPLSVSMALGMTANGARGATWDAMRTALGFGSMDENAMNEAYAGLLRQLLARDPAVEFTIANSVWHEATFVVEQPFLDAARDHFDAEVRALDFRAASAPSTISRWAEDKTGGRIKDLIQSIDPLEVLFLVNAVYFKAPWSEPFEERATRDGPFHTLNGTTVNVPMMSGDAGRPFFRDADADVIELVYADSVFGMVVVAPAEGRSLDQILTNLTPTRWNEWMNGLARTRILLTMPRFRFDYGTKLNDALSMMGMAIAFDANNADFDRINPTRNDLYISRVEHKTFIDVHERGTEAAAATAVGMAVTSVPPSITIDRPFLFVIRERTSGTILFLGRVGDPAAG